MHPPRTVCPPLLKFQARLRGPVFWPDWLLLQMAHGASREPSQPYFQQGECSKQCVMASFECSFLSDQKSNQTTLSLWRHRLQCIHGLLCNSSERQSGSVPGQQCPKLGLWPLSHRSKEFAFWSLRQWYFASYPRIATQWTELRVTSSHCCLNL